MGQQVYFAAEGNAGITSKILTTVEIIQVSVDPYNVIIIIVPCFLLWEYTMLFAQMYLLEISPNMTTPNRASGQSMHSLSVMQI